MKNSIKILAVLALIVGAIVGTSYVNNLQFDKERAQSTDNIEALKGEIVTFKNAIGQTVAEKKALQVSSDQIKELSNSVDWIKSEVSKMQVNIAAKVEQKTQVKEVEIRYKEPLPFAFQKPFNSITDNYSLFGESSNLGIKIDSLNLQNDLIFSVGKKKRGWRSGEPASTLLMSQIQTHLSRRLT